MNRLVISIMESICILVIVFYLLLYKFSTFRIVNEGFIMLTNICFMKKRRTTDNMAWYIRTLVELKCCKTFKKINDIRYVITLYANTYVSKSDTHTLVEHSNFTYSQMILSISSYLKVPERKRRVDRDEVSVYILSTHHFCPVIETV